MALTAVQIASQALVRLGALPISDFAEPTLEARTAAALYPTLRDTLLAGHAWRFATAEAELSPAAEAPLDGFAHAFRLPAGFLNALAVGEGRETGWRIAGGRLHAHTAPLRLAYVFRAGEAEFPPWFADALAAHLAAALCLPVTENTSRAEALQRLADTALRRARRTDALQNPARAPLRFPLIEARA